MRQYRLSLVGRGLGPQAVNQMMCALRFYKTAMGIKDAHDPIPGRGGLTRYRQFCRERRSAVFFRPLHGVKYETAFGLFTPRACG